MLLTHVFLFEISTPGILRLLLFKPQGISWCLCVVPRWRRRSVSSWVHSWPVGKSGTVPFDSVILRFIIWSAVVRALVEVLDKLNQGQSTTRLTVVEATGTNGEDTDTSQPRRRVRSKCTFTVKKKYATDDLAQFSVTGPTDASNKLIEIYSRVCWKNVSVLTHCSSQILKQFQGMRHFARDQRLQLETTGWRVFLFFGNILNEEELERQRNKILRAPLVVRDREYPFREHLIPDASGNVDPQLPMLAKMSWLIDVLQLAGSYELVERLWKKIILTASWVNVNVGWSRNEVLVNSVILPERLGRLLVTFLIIHLF